MWGVILMTLMDVILGKSITLDEAEEELGRPDKAEETDLPLHVGRCAKRWAMSYRASKNNAAQLAQIRAVLIGTLAVLAFYSPPAQKIIALIF